MLNACQTIHEAFTNLPRYSYPYDTHQMPTNGIYILFEQGEHAHGTDRIVRIGTHTGQNNLTKRLNEHFITPDKDRSILRGHIGRCLLAKENDPFLEHWKINLTTRENKDKYARQIDKDKKNKVEDAVSNYIKNKLSFTIMKVDEKQDRLSLEEKFISTINQCAHCAASENWLGQHHPNSKIPKSGLWNVKGLKKIPFSQDEASELVADIRTK